MIAVASFAMREALRRRVFTVVAVLTAAFLVLYGLGCWQLFRFVDDIGSPVPGVEPRRAIAAVIFGLGMFGTLFLGSVLAIFLTLGVVRGDADRGLLQPLLVRPLTRTEFLVARAGAAAAVAAVYVLVVLAACMVITNVFGDWWPDRILSPAAALMLAVVCIAALSTAGSVALSATANGIAVFMAFGAGLVVGLLGNIAEWASSPTLEDVATVLSYALPYEGLYQLALNDITADTVGLTRLVVNLGILGGGEPFGAGLWLFALAWLAAVIAGAAALLRRRDL